MNNYPKISIITVVYNGEKYLEDTILSVVNQTYKNIEYIIIDGGSTDGTVDIIKKYEDRICHWVSEKDSGIYDAMNKGIDIIDGEWINFMNVGDSFYNHYVLESIFYKNYYHNADIIYGNHNVIYSNKTRVVQAGDIRKIWKGSQFCHQSAFISSELHKKNKFNLSNSIGADFEFFYKAYKENKNFEFIDVLVSNYSAGGISDIKRIESIVGHWNVVEKNFKTNMHYILLIIKEMVKKKLKDKLYL